MHKKILCVIPSLPQDLSRATIPSILGQTHPIDILLVLPKKVEGGTLAERLSWILNDGLSHVRLEDFDYILRVDGDVVLPLDFVEKNLEGEPDLRGDVGSAQLIKTSTFLRVMKGRFHPESDDHYLGLRYVKEKCKVYGDYLVKPFMVRGHEHQGVRYYLDSGTLEYKLGFEPIHLIAKGLRNWRNIFVIIWYFVAMLRRESKFDIADFVWSHQINRLRSLLVPN
jgi:hypothetical protein